MWDWAYAFGTNEATADTDADSVVSNGEENGTTQDKSESEANSTVE